MYLLLEIFGYKDSGFRVLMVFVFKWIRERSLGQYFSVKV